MVVCLFVGMPLGTDQTIDSRAIDVFVAISGDVGVSRYVAGVRFREV